MTWAEGVPTLLPKAEHISFVQPATKEEFIVPWGAAVSVAGDLLAAQGMHPERFRVARFPSPVQLEQLRSKACAH